MENNHASAMKKELEGFKLSTEKISGKINAVGDIWRDGNYISLQAQNMCMSEINVSTDALTKVKATLNDYRIDISFFAPRAKSDT